MSNLRIWTLSLVGVLFCALAAVGCGGSSTQPAATTAAPDVRYAAMSTLETLQASLSAETPAEVSAQLAAKMASMPEFTESGVTPDHCAYGRFTDGRLIIFVNNRQPAPEVATYPAVVPSGRLGGSSLTPGQFRLIDTMGNIFQHPVNTMYPTLVAAGMQPAGPIQKGTVDEFLTMKGDGFIYLDAHGMSIDLKSGERVTAIWTGTQATKELDEKYKAMLDAEELVYCVGIYDSGQPQRKHYGMTPAFFKKYVSFAPNSVVFFNACHSANEDMAAACKSAGAGIYMGWDNSTEDLSAIYAAYFLLDRTLGLYKLEPQVENPAEKQALDMRELISAMATSKCPQTNEMYDISRATKAKLRFVLGNETLGGVVPVIADAEVDSTTGIINIVGVFDTTPGSVLANVTETSAGAPLPILSWSNSSISVQGNKSVDSVVVKVGGRSSKPRLLTGTFVLSGNQPVSGEPAGPIEVRSKLVVQLNGETVYSDPDGAVRGNRGPITFKAKKGDSLKIQVFSDEIYGGLGDVYITGPNGKTYRIVARTVDYITDKATRTAFTRSWDLRYYF